MTEAQEVARQVNALRSRGPEGRTAVYKFFAADGTPIYVGLTWNPHERFNQYKGFDWWLRVARTEFDWFDTRREAEIAEVIAIEDLDPVLNRRHANPWRPRATVTYPTETIVIGHREYAGPPFPSGEDIPESDAVEMLLQTRGDLPAQRTSFGWIGRWRGFPHGDRNGPRFVTEAVFRKHLKDALTIKRKTLTLIADQSSFVGSVGCPGFYSIKTAVALIRQAGLKTTPSALRGFISDGRFGDEGLGWFSEYGKPAHVAARHLRRLVADLREAQQGRSRPIDS